MGEQVICNNVHETYLQDLINNNRDITKYKYNCKICSRPFTTSSNRVRHEKICKKIQEEDVIKNLQKEVQSLREIVNNLNNAHSPNVQTTNNNVQNNNVQNNVTIHLKSFGCENIDHLESDKEYLTQCLQNKDVISLLESIHFDAQYPENLNVRMKNAKKEFMEKFVNGKWIISDQDETLDELLNKGYRILNYFSYKNKSNIMKEYEDEDNMEEYQEMKDWLEDLYSDSKLRKPLRRKLLILFMNNKTLFLEKSES
jgi:hypothetical protein